MSQYVGTSNQIKPISSIVTINPTIPMGSVANLANCRMSEGAFQYADVRGKNHGHQTECRSAQRDAVKGGVRSSPGWSVVDWMSCEWQCRSRGIPYLLCSFVWKYRHNRFYIPENQAWISFSQMQFCTPRGKSLFFCSFITLAHAKTWRLPLVGFQVAAEVWSAGMWPYGTKEEL